MRYRSIKIFDIKYNSLVDYEGEIATVLYTQGCNYNCPFCINPELKTYLDFDVINDEVLFKKHNTAFVITGGEPCIYYDLPYIIKDIQKKGYKVRLNTNGSFPKVLERCKPDFICMSVKTVWRRYNEVGDDRPHSHEYLKQSKRYLRNSGIPYEFVLVNDPNIVTPAEILEIKYEIPEIKLINKQ